MSDLADCAAQLAAWLPRARALITRPDIDGTHGAGQPGSAPPWNPAAAAATMDAHEGLRRLEASLRLAVTGRTGQRRGGSDANTQEALRAIEALGEAVTTDAAAQAARILDRWSVQVQQLPAIDRQERWLRVDAMCPYCRFPNSLRVAVRSRKVTCLRYGACQDGDGNHPAGVMEVGAASAQPCVAWQDGLVT